MIGIGLRVKSLRKHKHLTQLQLAEMLGVTKAMVSAYENGIRFPSYDILIKLSGIFGVTTDYLLGLEVHQHINLDGLTSSQVEIVTNIITEFRKNNVF